MNRTRIVVAAWILLTAAGMGFGGPGTTLSWLDYRDLDRILTEMNHKWLRRPSVQPFEHAPETWWLGGHGAGHVEPVTLGGWGMAHYSQQDVDSLGSDIAAVIGGFEAGYPWAPQHIDWFWLRPCLDLTAGGFFIAAHSLEPGQSDFFQWYAGWQLAVMPSLEVMGRLPYAGDAYVGIYLKAGYHLPFIAPQWYGDYDDFARPDLSLRGFQVSTGVRFGRMAYRPYRF